MNCSPKRGLPRLSLARARRSLATFSLAGGLSILAAGPALAATPNVGLNTLGYLPEAIKQATVAMPFTNFTLVRVADGGIAFTGLAAAPAEPAAPDAVWTADFSALREPGRYCLVVPGVATSAVFQVQAELYREPFRTATRAMYLWRCGTAVRGEYRGQIFAHGACHTNDAVLESAEGAPRPRATAGGWHDAGDYNKYVVNAGITVGMMLRAWEDFGPQVRQVRLDLPDVPAGRSEFLAEVQWELAWLLTMQTPDGSVHHKLSTKRFGGFIPPETETTARYLTPWSSAATADFVAMLAQAARCFRAEDPATADRYLAAARRSQQFLAQHPEDHPADLAGFSTGAYQTRDPDDRLWAVAELWETTGEEPYLQELETRVRAAAAKVDANWDWGNVRNLGLYTYLFSRRPGRDAALVQTLREQWLATADGIVQTARRQPYRRPLGELYYWGGNGTVARQCLVLQGAFRLTARREYRDTALDALNHLFGRNVHGRSYVTGLGDQPPRHPHDRRSGSDAVDDPWPGYLVGGPNPKAADWRDEQEDYRTNEIAINWNGALIYALAWFLDATSLARDPDVMYIPTPQVVVDRMLELAEVRPNDVVYDLGCGDGRILVTAAKRYGVRAVGYEIDPNLARRARDNARQQGVAELVTIREADLFAADLGEATVVTLYLLPELNVRLMPQLAKLKPGSRILSHDFDMEGAKPNRVESLRAAVEDWPNSEVETHTLFQWIVPWATP